jgi:hypothetical protein
MKALVRDMRSMLADVGTMKFGPELIKGVVKNYKEVPGKVQSTINKAKRLSFKIREEMARRVPKKVRDPRKDQPSVDQLMENSP